MLSLPFPLLSQQREEGAFTNFVGEETTHFPPVAWEEAIHPDVNSESSSARSRMSPPHTALFVEALNVITVFPAGTPDSEPP